MFDTECDREDAVFHVTPKCLGLGRDVLIGGATGPHYQVIDLSALTHPVTVAWCGPDSGIITDGADSIVFQGVRELRLPAVMREAA